MAQKAPEKVQAIIDKNKKIDILVAFKAAYPNAVIAMLEKPLEEILEAEPEVDYVALAKENARLIVEEEAEAKAKAEADKLAVKAAKKAELEAELKALDES